MLITILKFREDSRVKAIRSTWIEPPAEKKCSSDASACSLGSGGVQQLTEDKTKINRKRLPDLQAIQEYRR
jgi:hypothetical protein